MQLASNPQLAELAGRVMLGRKPETPLEQMQMQLFLFSVNRHGELAFRQYENDLIDEQTLVGMPGPAKYWLRPDVGQEIWKLQKAALNANCTAFVDAWTENAGSSDSGGARR